MSCHKIHLRITRHSHSHIYPLSGTSQSTSQVPQLHAGKRVHPIVPSQQVLQSCLRRRMVPFALCQLLGTLKAPQEGWYQRPLVTNIFDQLGPAKKSTPSSTCVLAITMFVLLL